MSQSQSIPLGAEDAPRGLGEIALWPGGYAMTLGYAPGGNNTVRCCGGHKTPEAAREHGIIRTLETVQAVSAQSVRQWANAAAEDGAA